jgi:SulP family sulfate permease
VGSLAVIWLGLDTRTVGDIASIKGGFPAFHIPDVAFNWQTLQIIFPPTITATKISGTALVNLGKN